VNCLLKWCYVVLHDIFIVLDLNRNLDINHCGSKSVLNPCFRMKLLPYDLKTSLSWFSCPSMPTYRYICIEVVLVVRAESRLSKIILFFKTNSIWLSTPTHLPLFNAIFPRRLNRVSRRLKRIGEEETGCHKPFPFDLKEVMSSNGTFGKPTV